jgi:hypothetical protein
MSLARNNPFQQFLRRGINLSEFKVERKRVGDPVLIAPEGVILKRLPAALPTSDGYFHERDVYYDVSLFADDSNQYEFRFSFSTEEQCEVASFVSGLEEVLNKGMSAATPHLGLPLYYDSQGWSLSLHQSSNVEKLIKETTHLTDEQRAYIVYQMLLAIKTLHEHDLACSHVGAVNLDRFVVYDLGETCPGAGRYYVEWFVGERSVCSTVRQGRLKAMNCYWIGSCIQLYFSEQHALIKQLLAYNPETDDPSAQWTQWTIAQAIDVYNDKYSDFQGIALEQAKLKEGLVTKKSTKELGPPRAKGPVVLDKKDTGPAAFTQNRLIKTPYQAFQNSGIDLSKFKVERKKAGDPVLTAPKGVILKHIPALSGDYCSMYGMHAYEISFADSSDRYEFLFSFSTEVQAKVSFFVSGIERVLSKGISAATPHLGLPLYYDSQGWSLSLRQSSNVKKLIEETTHLTEEQRAYIVYQMLLAIKTLHKHDLACVGSDTLALDRFVVYDLGEACPDAGRYYVELFVEGWSLAPAAGQDRLKAMDCYCIGLDIQMYFGKQYELTKQLSAYQPKTDDQSEQWTIAQAIDVYDKEYPDFQRIALKQAKLKEGFVTQRSKKEVADEDVLDPQRQALKAALNALEAALAEKKFDAQSPQALLFQAVKRDQSIIPPDDLGLAIDFTQRLRAIVLDATPENNADFLVSLNRVLPKPTPWFKKAAAFGLCVLGVALLVGAATLTVLTGGLASPILVTASLLADQMIAVAGYTLGLAMGLGGMGLFSTCKAKKERLTSNIAGQARLFKQSLSEKKTSSDPADESVMAKTRLDALAGCTLL